MHVQLNGNVKKHRSVNIISLLRFFFFALALVRAGLLSRRRCVRRGKADATDIVMGMGTALGGVAPWNRC